VRADLGPTPRIKPGEPDRAPPSGNPLWAIPLKDLDNTRERPIFSPSRRPPPPPVVEKPYVPPPPPPVVMKPPPEPLMLSLLGTIAGDTAGVALFMEKGSQEVVRLRTGEAHQGWVLRSVRGREAMLEKGDCHAAEPRRRPGRSGARRRGCNAGSATCDGGNAAEPALDGAPQPRGQVIFSPIPLTLEDGDPNFRKALSRSTAARRREAARQSAGHRRRPFHCPHDRDRLGHLAQDEADCRKPKQARE
jgi:hypothetical protein